jgi:hypothetical protein
MKKNRKERAVLRAYYNYKYNIIYVYGVDAKTLDIVLELDNHHLLVFERSSRGKSYALDTMTALDVMIDLENHEIPLGSL